MRYLFIAILCLSFALPALAQSSGGDLDTLLGNEKEEAKPLVTLNDYVNAHYMQCLDVKNAVFHDEGQKDVCACAAANLSQFMTVEQMKALGRDDSEGTYQRTRMLSFAYQPCIQPVLRDDFLKTCVSDPKVTSFLKHPVATCSCIAERFSKDLKKFAPQFIKGIALKNLPYKDPLDAIVKTKTYESVLQHRKRDCMLKHHEY